MQLKAQPATGTLNRKQRRALKKNGAAPLRAAPEQVQLGDISAELEQARGFQEAENFNAAKEIYDRLLKLHSNHPDLYVALAAFHQLQNNPDNAYLALKQLVTIAPHIAEYWSALSLALKLRSEVKAAIIARKKSIELQPDNAESYVQLGMLLDRAYDSDRAMAAFEFAVKIDPKNHRALISYGRKLQALGEFKQANEAFWTAFKLYPRELTACLSILRGKELEEEDVDNILARLETILETEDLSDRGRGMGLSCMAQIYDRKKDYDRSFHFYFQANQMDRKEDKFECEKFERYINVLIESFQPEVFEHLKEAASPSQLPTLVVGMPRSGTTLVEQIMGSHSKVFGAGEMVNVQKMESDLIKASIALGSSYPRNLSEMNCEGLAQMGERHLADLRGNYSSSALRIIDKMPANILSLGLVALLFPQASIIHTMRDPMDTGWSCFTQNFDSKGSLCWTNSLEDIGFYYQQYRRLVDHWHKVLPLKILDVQYEELLDDQEGISQQMIEHIGLDWEEACLKFNEQDQSVQTASVWQVRQPIYKTSVEKWRRYEKHLGPLQQALGPYT